MSVGPALVMRRSRVRLPLWALVSCLVRLGFRHGCLRGEDGRSRVHPARGHESLAGGPRTTSSHPPGTVPSGRTGAPPARCPVLGVSVLVTRLDEVLASGVVGALVGAGMAGLAALLVGWRQRGSDRAVHAAIACGQLAAAVCSPSISRQRPSERSIRGSHLDSAGSRRVRPGHGRSRTR